MAITTKKPPRTPEEFIAGAETFVKDAETPKNEPENSVLPEHKETENVKKEKMVEKPYIRDKKFLLSIPFELHKLAVNKAKERNISLHEFILKATDREVREN